jgi:hypothetical protein
MKITINKVNFKLFNEQAFFLSINTNKNGLNRLSLIYSR